MKKELTQEEYEKIVAVLNNFGNSFMDFDRALLNTTIMGEATQSLLIDKGILTIDEITDRAKELFQIASDKIRETQEQALKQAAEEVTSEKKELVKEETKTEDTSK